MSAIESLQPHADQFTIPSPVVGLGDVSVDEANHYLDTIIDLLFATLADADPWTEVYNAPIETDRDGYMFGMLESFSDILPYESPLFRAVERFGPVGRQPETIQAKNRLVAWLAFRHRVIATLNAHFDETPAMCEIAAEMTAGISQTLTRSQAIRLYRIPDEEYYFARNQVHGPSGFYDSQMDWMYQEPPAPEEYEGPVAPEE